MIPLSLWRVAFCLRLCSTIFQKSLVKPWIFRMVLNIIPWLWNILGLMNFYHFRSRQGATLQLQEEGRRGIRQSLLKIHEFWRSWRENWDFLQEGGSIPSQKLSSNDLIPQGFQNDTTKNPHQIVVFCVIASGCQRHSERRSCIPQRNIECKKVSVIVVIVTMHWMLRRWSPAKVNLCWSGMEGKIVSRWLTSRHFAILKILKPNTVWNPHQNHRIIREIWDIVGRTSTGHCMTYIL